MSGPPRWRRLSTTAARPNTVLSDASEKMDDLMGGQRAKRQRSAASRSGVRCNRLVRHHPAMPRRLFFIGIQSSDIPLGDSYFAAVCPT